PESDVVTMVVERDPRLRTMAVFDALANNADRKGGHILPMTDGHVYGVDHGICFAVEPKLRTVLWGWRGDALSDEEVGVVRGVCEALDDGPLEAELRALLTAEEVRATRRRADALLSSGRFPEPDPSRPALPWPPF
ncbi:MAG TPA: SCO1664 family protein, partial [Candidatus Limnocylindrales bacterium]|nr:SCO1664 family protein [Candidatus Limnocylindrales bacterium]